MGVPVTAGQVHQFGAAQGLCKTVARNASACCCWLASCCRHEKRLLLHAAVAAQWSAKGGGTTLELLGLCKQNDSSCCTSPRQCTTICCLLHLLYILLPVLNQPASQLAWLAMYCSANGEGIIMQLAADAVKGIMDSGTTNI